MRAHGVMDNFIQSDPLNVEAHAFICVRSDLLQDLFVNEFVFDEGFEKQVGRYFEYKT